MKKIIDRIFNYMVQVGEARAEVYFRSWEYQQLIKNLKDHSRKA